MIPASFVSSVSLCGPHVGLGLDHFVHKLPEADGVVVRQPLHQLSCRRSHLFQPQSSSQSPSHLDTCSPSSSPIFFKLLRSSAMELEKSMRM